MADQSGNGPGAVAGSISPEQAGQGGSRVNLRIDESKMQTSYANTIRTTTTHDEVVLDFGLNMPMQGGDGQQTLLFQVGSRIVLNWPGAKRLASSLAQIINAYEKENGEIKLQQR